MAVWDSCGDVERREEIAICKMDKFAKTKKILSSFHKLYSGNLKPFLIPKLACICGFIKCGKAS